MYVFTRSSKMYATIIALCIAPPLNISDVVMNVGCILYFASDAHRFNAYILTLSWLNNFRNNGEITGTSSGRK